MERRFAFDQVATLYGTARPEYPDALVDDVVSFADLRANDRILEVGCGTGQATKGFAKRGFPILAIDPGPEMLRVARESLVDFSNVQFLETTFEAWPAGRAVFRLIVAAQSWHWVPREVGFVKAAEVLSSNGSLAVFAHVPVGLPTTLLAKFNGIYMRQPGTSPEDYYLPSGHLKGWFEESELFGPVEHKSYLWKKQHTTSSYTDYLRTRSDCRMMESAKREQVLSGFVKAIDAHGGAFDMDYETHLYIARRANRIR
jgi:ubiquinone/menaquinone biosynthesis C-methylase UbiE